MIPSVIRRFQSINPNQYLNMGIRRFASGDVGSGAGKGGGAGGTIREAGGGMGKRGAAIEEEYFHKKKTEQLRRIRQAQETASRGGLTKGGKPVEAMKKK